MSNKPVYALGYALNAVGVPCAEEIAMMLCQKPYGYIYDGIVLQKPKWDEDAYPNAIMYRGNPVKLYVSANPFNYDTTTTLAGYVRVAAPYLVSSYDRTTNTWGAFEAVLEEGKFLRWHAASSTLWANHDIVNPDGNVIYEKYEPQPFYLNRKNTPTAFLYDSGKIVFQANSIPDANSAIVGAYVGWHKTQYTSSFYIPWLLMDRDSIVRATINEDAIPAHTDYWFYNCSYLKYVTLPNGMKRIGDYMFYKTLLYDFYMPDTIEEIGKYAYASLVHDATIGSLDRRTIVIPDSCRKIGEGAFRDNEIFGNVGKGLGVLTIGSGCEEIGDYAFSWCNRLKNITIGPNVKRIGKNAFIYCGATIVGDSTIHTDGYASITFENTEGWWISKDSGAVEGTAIDVTDATQNALNLAGIYDWDGSYISASWTTRPGVYAAYYWNRSE